MWPAWQSGRLSRQQKEKLQQLINLTGVSERVALSSLKATAWSLEAAADALLSSHVTGGGGAQQQQQQQGNAEGKRYEDLFLKYKDPDSDLILADGISKLCQDLKVEPSDVVMLVLSWHMGAATVGEFSKQEFLTGLRSLGADSLPKLQAMLPNLRSEMKTPHKFSNIYDFSFSWAREKGQKSLALDTAIGMWRLLFEQNGWPLAGHWCTFLEERHSKAISKDTWSQLLEFSKLSEAQLASYDDQGAWPCLIDDFVLYLQETGVLKAK